MRLHLTENLFHWFICLSSCRLQGLPFQVALLAPILLILLVNFIAFILIVRSLLTTGTKVSADRKTSGITQARRSFAILVVLGLTWVFGVLAIKDAKLVFQYLFCIFNSFQGLLVFIFYCALPRDTRRKWKSLCLDKGKSGVSSVRKDYFSDPRFQNVTFRTNIYTGNSLSNSHRNSSSLST